MRYKVKLLILALILTMVPIVAANVSSVDAQIGGTGAVDHYLGYEIRPKTLFEPLTVHLRDQFGDAFYDVTAPVRLYNPAYKNNEGTIDSRMHLVGYKIVLSPDQNRQPTIKNILITNQFGHFLVNTKRPNLLMVPSFKEHGSVPDVPPTPDQTALDHFKCYGIKAIARFDPTGFIFQGGIQAFANDQFDQGTNYAVRRPIRLCNPVDKNQEGMRDPNIHLMCYLIRRFAGTPEFNIVKGLGTNNQFGPMKLRATVDRELCVPSIKQLPLDPDQPVEPVLPDLTITLINAPTIVDCPGGGGTCTHMVDFMVDNLSAVAGSPAFQVNAATSNGLNIVLGFGPLPPGGSLVATATMGPGNNCYDPNCTVTVEVDPTNAIAETNEGNNTASRTDLG